MRTEWTRRIWITAALAFACCDVMAPAGKPALQNDGWSQSDFKVTSTTFPNDGTMPLSTIYTIIPANSTSNACTANGAAGGNESPELSWTRAPWGTRSFVVILYDMTASFTHWGMYNIAPHEHKLPMNAGAPGSAYGKQIVNDFGNAQYDGPCPPANVAPNVHDYVFTVYALDTELSLPGSTNFPANAETLYHALIEAGRKHQILASASWTGLYSATP